MHPNQAITAVARHLLVIVWHLLSKQEPYRQVTEERIAYKFLTWSWQLNEQQRAGMSRPQFVRYHLLRLGIGADLNRIVLNPKYPHRIAPIEEVLALKPELRPPS